MNYKLAKQLKDAGFPKKTKIALELNLHRYFSMDANPISFPFLQELIKEIETKGSWFIALDPNRQKEEEKYVAVLGQYDGFWEYEENGNSPEEAVAKLWLKLNKGE